MWERFEAGYMAEQDAERTSVRTYVPAYQKGAWAEHAEDLEMSLSEYVRTMVQAGKRGFEGTNETVDSTTDEEPGSEASNPRGDGLETVILDSLEAGPLEFDELVEEVVDDFRRDVDAALDRLEDEDRVEHDRLNGGYRVTDDG